MITFPLSVQSMKSVPPRRSMRGGGRPAQGWRGQIVVRSTAVRGAEQKGEVPTVCLLHALHLRRRARRARKGPKVESADD